MTFAIRTRLLQWEGSKHTGNMTRGRMGAPPERVGAQRSPRDSQLLGTASLELTDSFQAPGHRVLSSFCLNTRT
jgi:hypothetical protein